MTISFMAGRRIQGLDSDLTATALPSGSIGGWVQVGRTTLGSAGDTITVSNIPDKRYYMVLSNWIPTGGATDTLMRLGNGSTDATAKYAYRASDNNGSDYTATTTNTYYGNPDNTKTTPTFMTQYIANKSDKEKLSMHHSVNQNSAGASSAPNKQESVGKWTETSNPLDTYTLQNAGAGSYASGSEVVVLGYDPADTHTNNFWEELYSGSGASGMDTGANGFTAKRYLWIQMYLEDMISGGNVQMVLNGLDSSNNYACRYIINDGSGGGSSFLTSRSDNLIHLGQSNETNAFINIFIVNTGSNEKLGMVFDMTSQQAGAGYAPSRQKIAFKDSQSTQITDVEIRRANGSWGANSRLKIWGAD